MPTVPLILSLGMFMCFNYLSIYFKSCAMKSMNSLEASLILTSALMLSSCDDDEITRPKQNWPVQENVQHENNSLSQLDFKSPQPTMISKPLQYYGVVRGHHSVDLSVFSAGRVERNHVLEGQYVKQGDKLMTLYSPTLNEQLEQATAAFHKSQAHRIQQQKRMKRAKKLLQSELMTPQEWEELERDAQTAQQNEKEAASYLEQIKNEISELSVIAKQDGIVAKIYRRDGDFFNAGQALMRFESISSSQAAPQAMSQKVSFKIPETVAVQLNVGQLVEIYIPAIQKKTFGTVTEKALPDTQSLRLFQVTVELPSDAKPWVGLRSTLMLHTEKKSAFKIDYNALRYHPSGTAYVFEKPTIESANPLSSKHNTPIISSVSSLTAPSLKKTPVTVEDLVEEHVIVSGPIDKHSTLLIHQDINLPMNLSTPLSND